MNLRIKFNKETGKVAIYDGEKIVAEMIEQPTSEETLRYAELFQSSYQMHDVLKSINQTMQQGNSIDVIKNNLNNYITLFTYNK